MHRLPSIPRAAALLALLAIALPRLHAQSALPDSPTPPPGSISGIVADTDNAAIPNAQLTLEALNPTAPIRALPARPLQTLTSGPLGAFTFSAVPPGTYRIRIHASGFSAWKVEDIAVAPGQAVTLDPIQLGVEAIDSVVDAITVEDLAERQITAEEHQRILGVLPNFYVSYVPNPQPLTRRQKFKLALVVSRDPLTFGSAAINAAIEQAQGDFAGYGAGPAGYAQRFAASYGDHLSATFLGSALFPSLLHQDPRYFYLGRGSVLHRALYAISTVVICRGDNGRWQPNYSNVLGNIGSGALSSLYYPASSRHDLQTTADNIVIGIGEGSFGTLFQEFLLRHFTHGIRTNP